LSDPQTPEAVIPKYDNVTSAPYVYFDRVAAHGVIGGAIQLELASRTLIPLPDGGVEVRFATSGRLRCSPAAAIQLRDAAIAVLKMHDQSEVKTPTATSKLN